MTTRIIALIALLALLATPPPRITTTCSRTTGRTRRFKLARGRRANVINSFVNKSFCSSYNESVGCEFLSLLSRTKKKICAPGQKFSKIHTFWFHHFSRKHVHTTMRCVSLSLPLFSLSAVALDVHVVALERLKYSRFYRSRGIARGGVCLRAHFHFHFFFRCFLRARGVAVPKFLTSSRSLFNHHAVKSSTYKPASAVTKSGQSSGRCAMGFFPFLRSL